MANPEWENYDTQCGERTRDASYGRDHRCELERGHKPPHVDGDYWWEVCRVAAPVTLTRRQVLEAQERQRAEAHRREEPSAERHARYVAEALEKGIRNLTAADYRRVREMAGPTVQGAIVGWPDDAPAMHNPSELCDMWSGPCSCGAWHWEGI